MPDLQFFIWFEVDHGTEEDSVTAPAVEGNHAHGQRPEVGYFWSSAARVVVASNGGQAADPGWVANLREHPQAEIFVGRQLQLVSARFAEGEEYEALWKTISERVPVYADYQRKCEAVRQIPLVVLEPR